MSKRIVVDPAKLESAAKKIEEQANEYERHYNLLFSEVDGMGTAWQGADNVAFTSQIKGFMDDFQAMKKLMLDYANFLNFSAKTYRTTQQEIIQAAKRLSN